MQLVEAAETGLPPKQPVVLALADDPKGAGRLEPLAGFTTNSCRRRRQHHRSHPSGYTKRRRDAEAVSGYRCWDAGAAGRAGASANAAMRGLEHRRKRSTETLQLLCRLLHFASANCGHSDAVAMGRNVRASLIHLRIEATSLSQRMRPMSAPGECGHAALKSEFGLPVWPLAALVNHP